MKLKSYLLAMLASVFILGTLTNTAYAQPTVKLRNLERSPGEGYRIQTDGTGRAFWIMGVSDEINVDLTPIAFVPATFGNVTNLNEVVTDPNGDIWIIDSAGDAVKIGTTVSFSGDWDDLTNVPAGFADGTDNVNDADSDPLNEIQESDEVLLSNPVVVNGIIYYNVQSAVQAIINAGVGTGGGFSGDWADLTSVPAGFADNTDDVDDADADPANEIQVLTISNDTVFLSDGGFVVLPASASTDDRVPDILTSLGISAYDDTMGSYPGTVVPDAGSVKDNITALEAAIEAIPGGGGVDSFLVSESEIYRKTESSPTGNNITDILSGTIVPIASNPTLTDTIQKPFGFTAPVPFWISRNEDGTYATQYDDIRVWRDSFLSTVPTNGVYYVDGIAGSDANDGRTKATAKQTLNAVRVLTPAPRRVYIKGGLYKTNTFVMGADTLQLIAYGGTAEIFRSITFPASWSAVGGGVYSTTQASVGSSRILMSTSRDEEGLLIPLKQVGTLAELTNGVNSYYTDGTTFYTILDGAAPVEFGNIVIAANAHTGMTQPRFYAEGIRWYGASSYDISTGKAVFRDCSNYYLNDGSSADLISFSNGCTVYLHNSTFGYAGADAIDWNGANTVGYEINCKGRWAGLSGVGSNDQISTGHAGSKVVTVNADYQFARSQALADINTDTQRWILGGFFGNSWEYTSGAISALTDAELWVDNAKVGGRQFDYTVWDTGTLHLRNIKINQNSRVDVQAGGTISEY